MRSFLGVWGCMVVAVVGVQNFDPLHAQPDTLSGCNGVSSP
ncbi:MAG: hypothetical protein QMD71_08120 [bacterium]|nr:hypothetical protein [bacterium]